MRPARGAGMLSVRPLFRGRTRPRGRAKAAPGLAVLATFPAIGMKGGAVDSKRFYSLVRVLATGISRRGALAGMAALTGRGLVDLDEAAAKKKRGKKKKKKTSTPSSPPPPP